MKKVMTILLVALLAAFTQSCKRSNDSVAKEYCEKLKTSLENRDFEEAEKLKDALNTYCTKLDDNQINEMMQSLQKYVKELKVDSVYFECIKEISKKQGLQEGQAMRSKNVDEDSAPQSEGGAMPDTLRL